VLLTVGQGGDGCDRFGEDGFGVWVLMLGVPGVRVGSAGGGLGAGQLWAVSLTACRAEDSSTIPVLAA
jgi:hypothetical protein